MSLECYFEDGKMVKGCWVRCVILVKPLLKVEEVRGVGGGGAVWCVEEVRGVGGGVQMVQCTAL